MRTVETRIYQFDELSDKAKGKARDWYRESIADWDWWDFLYDDAQEIGMEIKDFDLCRRDISGKLTMTVRDCVKAIMEQHGKKTDTRKLADEYAVGLVTSRLLGEEQDDDEDDLDVSEAFRDDLLKIYLHLLQEEYDGMNSDEYIDEHIMANEYEFEADGSLF